MNRTLLPALLLLAATGCSGTWSQQAARDAATQKSCDYYARCGEIQRGARYNTREDCEIEVRAYWNNAWPAEDCDNKIRNEDMDVCLRAIENTQCDNAGDFFNTLFNKCSRSNVCKGPQ